MSYQRYEDDGVCILQLHAELVKENEVDYNRLLEQNPFLADWAEPTKKQSHRPIVKGRELQLDADFLCYESADLDEELETNFKALLRNINYKRKMAGAETVAAHITLGSKSGREQMATVKAYQENRDPDAPIKVRVRELRKVLSKNSDKTITPVFNELYEADDTMCIRQNQRISELGVDSTVLMSGDKDLWMVQGWHCNMKNAQLEQVGGFGTTDYKEVGNKKPKLVGKGTSRFWHQMIIGERNDNIAGLEKLSNSLLDQYQPL